MAIIVNFHINHSHLVGPVSLPPRGGPWELLVGVPDANRDKGDEEKASGMSGFLLRQLVGCEYLISSRFQSFSSERGGGF